MNNKERRIEVAGRAVIGAIVGGLLGLGAVGMSMASVARERNPQPPAPPHFFLYSDWGHYLDEKVAGNPLLTVGLSTAAGAAIGLAASRRRKVPPE